MQGVTRSSSQPTWCDPVLPLGSYKTPQYSLIYFKRFTLYITEAFYTASTWHCVQCKVSAQVEHRGVMPSLVPKPGAYLQIVDQRKQLREVIWSCWPAVSQPSPHQPDLPFVVSTSCALVKPVYFSSMFLQILQAGVTWQAPVQPGEKPASGCL